MKVSRTEKQILVESAYNPALPAPAKNLGGKWDSGKKAWAFDRRDETRVEELYRGIYGEWPVEGAAGPAELVNIRVTVEREWYESKAALFLCGRQAAWASGRDSGARLGSGVLVLNGNFGSSGSVKNWATSASAGTIFELRDVPKAAAEKEISEGKNKELKIEIISHTVDKIALIAEKEALLDRLAEIENLLGN